MTQAENERVVLGCVTLIALALICGGIGGIFGYPWGLICFGLIVLVRLRASWIRRR